MIRARASGFCGRSLTDQRENTPFKALYSPPGIKSRQSLEKERMLEKVPEVDNIVGRE
jgi:hypothetical protein